MVRYFFNLQSLFFNLLNVAKDSSSIPDLYIANSSPVVICLSLIVHVAVCVYFNTVLILLCMLSILRFNSFE